MTEYFESQGKKVQLNRWNVGGFGSKRVPQKGVSEWYL